MHSNKIGALLHEKQSRGLRLLACNIGVGEVFANEMDELRRKARGCGLWVKSSFLECIKDPIELLWWNIRCGRDGFDGRINKKNGEDLSVARFCLVDKLKGCDAVLVDIWPGQGPSGLRDLQVVNVRIERRAKIFAYHRTQALTAVGVSKSRIRAGKLAGLAGIPFQPIQDLRTYLVILRMIDGCGGGNTDALYRRS
jgi:hypothetical protein